MESLSTLTLTPEGLNSVIKAQAGKVIGEGISHFLVTERSTTPFPAELVRFAAACSAVLANIFEYKGGAAALAKHCDSSHYLALLNCLTVQRCARGFGSSSTSLVSDSSRFSEEQESKGKVFIERSGCSVYLLMKSKTGSCAAIFGKFLKFVNIDG